MIREYTLEDLNEINIIGSLIKDNFVEKYSISELKNYDYFNLYVYDDGAIKGFIQIEKHFEILDIINIAVRKEYQHLGIGKMLLDYIINKIKPKQVLLEVRETNVEAIKFYKKNGFIEINRRKKYYGNEDAIIMERSI